MKKTLLVLSITLLGTLLSSNVMGQANAPTQPLILGMPEISLLSVTATVPVNLSLTTTTAGEAVEQSTFNDATKLRISSVVTGEATRTVSAKVDKVPSGTSLKLQATAPTSANFGGTMAAAEGYLAEVTLGSVDADIINGIGSCYSGTGELDGYVLKYTWGLDNPSTNYGLVRSVSGNTTVTVTLTLTAAN